MTTSRRARTVRRSDLPKSPGSRLAFTTDAFVVRPTLLSGRRRRTARGVRHGERSRGLRRATALLVGRVHPRGGAAARRLAPRRRLDACRVRAKRASRWSRVTRRSSREGKATACSSRRRASGWCRPAARSRCGTRSPATTSSCPGRSAITGSPCSRRARASSSRRRSASDVAPLVDLCAAVLETCDGTRWMRDATRGGAFERALRARCGVARRRSARRARAPASGRGPRRL